MGFSLVSGLPLCPCLDATMVVAPTETVTAMTRKNIVPKMKGFIISDIESTLNG